MNFKQLQTTLAATVFSPANATPTQSISANSNPTEGNYLLAQASDSCRQVNVPGLYVRQRPTVYSPVVGTILSGRNVTVESAPTGGWVAVSAPLEGYMFARYLIPCNPIAIAPDLCREVSARGGLLIRKEPSVNADIVGTVLNDRNVTIENRGADG